MRVHSFNLASVSGFVAVEQLINPPRLPKNKSKKETNNGTILLYDV